MEQLLGVLGLAVLLAVLLAVAVASCATVADQLAHSGWDGGGLARRQGR